MILNKQVNSNGAYKLIKVFDQQIKQQVCKYCFIKAPEDEQPILFLLRLLNKNLANKIFFQITMQVII